MTTTPRAPTTLSAAFLTRLGTVLDAKGIAHGPLREGAPALNLNASDGANVFVKVSRPGEAHGRADTEITGAAWATVHRIRVARPLLPAAVLLADDSGELREVSAWEWLPDTPGRPTRWEDYARHIPAVVVQIAQAAAEPTAAVFDFDFFIRRVCARIDNNSDPVAQVLLATAEQSAAVIAERLDPSRYRWVHGDLHFGNVYWLPTGAPLVLDWESNMRGPIEWDLAQFVRSAALYFPDLPVAVRDESVQAMVDRVAVHVPVDRDLLGACVRFRCASHGSHLWLHGHDRTHLLRNLALISELATPARVPMAVL